MSVNAPEAGTIKEFFVKEEDTVTVGQDLLKMETGGEVKDVKKTGGQIPKSPAADDQPTSSHPEPPKDNTNGGRDEKSQSASFPPPQTPKESSKFDINQHEQTKVNPQGPTASDSKRLGVNTPSASREERRVCSHQSIRLLKKN